MRLGVRRSGSIVVRVAITLVPGRDDDLIAAIAKASNGSATLREMMRSGIGKSAAKFVQRQDDEPEIDMAAMGGIEL